MRGTKWAQRDLLSHCALFAGLTPAQLDELQAASRLLELGANEYLFRAGEPIREAYLLVSGTLQRSTTLAGETTKVIELAQSQEMLGLGELFGATHYLSSGQTLSPCIIVAVDLRKLRNLIRRDLELSWRTIQAIGQRQCAIEFDATGYHYGLTSAQRLLDYLIELAGEQPGLAGETTVTLRTSKKIIAARIGMTPESLSRSLRQLSDQGVIVVEGRNVHIQNAALRETAAGKAGRRLSFSRKSKTDEARQGTSISPGELLNLCGRLRLLSQRMATAWALVGQSITPARAGMKMRQHRAEFDRVLARLGQLDLPGELAGHLAAVLDLWPRYRQALFDAEPAVENAARVLDLSEEILDAADRLAGVAENHAALPAAHHVNVAGRNRMLSQRVGKLFMFREWGIGNDVMRQRLLESCREFGVNLAELKRCTADVPELAAQLKSVAEHWQKFEEILHPNLEHANRHRHALAVQTEGERLLRYVDTAVKLYERLAR